MGQYPRDISDQVINDKVSVGSKGITLGMTVRKGKIVVAGGAEVATVQGRIDNLSERRCSRSRFLASMFGCFWR